MFQKKGVGTRRLKYRLLENPGILNNPHTSVRRNGLSRAIHMSVMLDDPSHIFPNYGSRWQTGKDVSDCGFSFKKTIIDDQIVEMASLNFTAMELSLFSPKKQRSKKIKTLYNCI